jgi:hypothetical protein
MSNQLTVLIPTSPIPSHPSTAILDETISNIRKYTDAKIFIMADGIHKSFDGVRASNYLAYLNFVSLKIGFKEYGNCELRVFDEHTHQVGMTKHLLLDEVKTPLIMFVEADTSPIGDIPFQEICDLVENNEYINYVRFNIFHKILEEHQHLMLDKEPIQVDGIPLVRTIQWSQRPHIAKTEWYKNIITDYFKPDEKMMIEDRLHGIVQEKYKQLKGDVFGLSIYTPPGNQLRSYHADGRGLDEKIIEA